MLKGKSLLLTGGTHGIGKSIIEKLAKQQVNIAFNGFNLDKDWLEKIKSDNKIECIHFDKDLCCFDETNQLADEAIKVFGSIDMLVNNAAMTVFGKVVDTETEDFLNVLNVNLISPQILIKKCVPGMINKKWGRVINISSVTAKAIEEGLSCYITSKSGLVGLTKVLAKELSGTGVTANCVMPGNTSTPMLHDGIKAFANKLNIPVDNLYSHFTNQSFIKRLLEPEEIASMVKYLCSDDGSCITGTVLEVTGGHGI